MINYPDWKRYAATALVVACAALMILLLWWHYMVSPWTRDGKVRAYVVNVAPQVSGEVVDLRLKDNQFVHKGDTLFLVDPDNYNLALEVAEATLASKQEDLRNKKENSERRLKLGLQAVSAEETHTVESSVKVAEAALREASAQRDLARLNLERATVRSPVNGFISNLELRQGDYAIAGQTRVSIVDSDSFWVSGYFEETKLPRIRVGASAKVRLMGVGKEVRGHVESISRGISDPNSLSDTAGLANVNPIFTWVRLAQRIPVRVHIDEVPPDIFLSSGQTCTVVISEDR